MPIAEVVSLLISLLQEGPQIQALIAMQRAGIDPTPDQLRQLAEAVKSTDAAIQAAKPTSLAPSNA